VVNRSAPSICRSGIQAGRYR